jgi:hypothetical protein
MKDLSLIPRIFGLLALCVATASAQTADDRKPRDPAAALRSAKYIYVQSSSLLVGASVVEEKLQQREEFSRMGLVITRDVNAADLVLELHHDVFTKYVYTAIDTKTSMVVASGKLSSLGGTVAGKVAKRFLKQVLKARATTSSGEPTQLNIAHAAARRRDREPLTLSPRRCAAA